MVDRELVGRIELKTQSALADGSGVRYVAGVVFLSALYVAAGLFSNGPLAESQNAPILFLPMGMGIAFLYVAGMRYWPGILVGSLLTEYAADGSGQVFGFALGGFSEIVLATVLLRRFVRRGRPLDTVEGVAGMVAAIAAGEVVGATIGSLTAQLSHAITTSGLPAFWRTWWLAGFCGGVLLVPIALAWCPWPHIDWRRRPSWDAILPLAAVVGSSAIVFQSGSPWSYAVFPALMWSAWRLGQRGATAAVAITSGFAVWATTQFLGPFHSFDASNTVVQTQLFMVVAAVSTMCFAAVATDRKRLARALRASLSRVVEASERERRRLERDLHDGAQAKLVAIQIRLELARRLPDRAQVDAQIDATQRDLEAAIGELRSLAHGIYPPALRDLGPAGALKSLAFSSSIPVAVVDEGVGRLPDATEEAIYFCAREAIQNTAKHAGPDARSTVTLRRARNSIELRVSDDGAGLPADGSREGAGITGMRERIEAVGGRFQIAAAPGGGTSILAAIPDGAARKAAPSRQPRP